MENTVDFMENTVDIWEIPVDIWEIPPERASRVGHPAPFPVELPATLIQLYSYRDDLILNPFVGVGTTDVASLQNDRRFVGYDLDGSYIETANERLAAERVLLGVARNRILASKPALVSPLAAAIEAGRSAKDLARLALESAGFDGIDEHPRFPGGVDVTFSAAETLWRTTGKAAILHGLGAGLLLLLVLTTELPAANSPATDALKMDCGPGKPVTHVIDLLAPHAVTSLRQLRDGQNCRAPDQRSSNRPD